jgi:hypothetical protein
MYLLSAHVSTLEFAGNGPRWRFRVKQAAANFFLLSMHQYGRSFLLFYIKKMAACIFTRSFVWHSSAQNIYMQSRIYVCNFLSAGYKIYARKYYNYTESTKYVYPIVGLNTKYRTSIFSFAVFSVSQIGWSLWLKNLPPLQRKGKLESHVLYLCTCQDCQKYPSTKCTRMYIFLSHEKVKNTWSLKATVSVFYLLFRHGAHW